MKTPLNDAIETAMSGAEIYVNNMKINTPEELEQALKKLEEDGDDGSNKKGVRGDGSGGSKDKLEG